MNWKLNMIKKASTVLPLALMLAASSVSAQYVNAETVRPIQEYWDFSASSGLRSESLTENGLNTTDYETESSTIEFNTNFKADSRALLTVRSSRERSKLRYSSDEEVVDKTTEVLVGFYLDVADNGSFSFTAGRGQIDEKSQIFGDLKTEDQSYEVAELTYRSLLGGFKNWELLQRFRHNSLFGPSYGAALVYNTPAGWSFGVTSTTRLYDYDYYSVSNDDTLYVSNHSSVGLSLRFNID